MATKPGEFLDESDSGEWAGDEDYGDGTTRSERVAMARAPGYKAKTTVTEEETSDYGPKTGRGAAGTSETVEAPAKPPAPKKAPIVTKEELAKSGLSLRDYMNKQQGLTRRGEPAPKAAPAPRANENYGNEGRTAKAPLRQVTQAELADSYVKKQAARKAEAAAEKAAQSETNAETARLLKKAPAPGRKRIDTSNLNPNTLLPAKTYKKGGDVRGWGIARGARKAKIV